MQSDEYEMQSDEYEKQSIASGEMLAALTVYSIVW
jgi:hypothetical protein